MFLCNVICDIDKISNIISCRRERWVLYVICLFYVFYVYCKIFYWVGVYFGFVVKKSVV